jgi:hypothetical protein
MTLYRSLLAWLAAISAEPAAIDAEPPRAAAAVAAAYASFAPADPPPSPPAPVACACGGKCSNGIYRPDGRIEMKCEASCACGCRKPKSVLAAPPACKDCAKSPAPSR